MAGRTPLLAILLALAAPAVGRAQPFQVDFLYKLSSTTGVLPFQGLAVSYDPYHRETLVVGEGRVRVFNETGMEIYSFGDDPEIGGVSAAAATDGGDFILVAYAQGAPGLIRANFRGEFKNRIELSGLPSELPSPFLYNAIGYAKGNVYLCDLGAMRLVVVDLDGKFIAYHDLWKLVDVEEDGPGRRLDKPGEKKADARSDYGIKGFRVAPNGEVLFTVQTLFHAYVLSPDGTIRSFGMKGSAPGKFNVITGIASDEQGNYYVADILKSAVIVFDKNFRWVKEFGYRGRAPRNLVSPVDVAAGDGKVFVSQYARKGVSVFAVKPGEAP